MEQTTARKITIIPVNPRYDYKAASEHRKKRRAAYARVSTDSEEQMTSYRAQVKYYTEMLSAKEDTEFVGVYADEGLSGTSVKNRKEFQRLMADCRAGKIDEIWVKSISRFARNIIDCVQHIRELKELGINIHFESINIDTLDSKGELLIVILASIAEEESRNISENIRWAKEKAFEQGKVMISTLYGYRKDENKQLIIDPETAPVVRRVFTDYLKGFTMGQIADCLNVERIPTYYGAKWKKEGIRRMLENEKYKGDAVLQKTYSPNFLSKKRVKNEGQARMFFVEGSHPPIIDRDTYDKVQAETKRRADLAADGERSGGKYSSYHVFSGKIKCGQCGEMLRRHGHRYKGEYIPLWLCKEKQLSKGKGCTLPHLKETDVEQSFVRMLNRLICDRDKFIDDFMVAADQIITDTDQAAYDAKVTELNAARDEMLELSHANAKHSMISIEYYDASLRLMDRIDMITEETKAVKDIIDAKKTARHRLGEIRQVLEGDILSGFCGEVFKQLVEMVTVKNGRELEFAFNCGITLAENV